MAHTDTETEVTTAEIREAWAMIQAGGDPLSHDPGFTEQYYGRWRSSRHDSFIGASGAQMNDWLQNGYWPEGESVPDLQAGEAFMPMLELNEEEGDLVLEFALANDDCPFVQWEPMAVPGGL